jgi:hypothetical protein
MRPWPERRCARFKPSPIGCGASIPADGTRPCRQMALGRAFLQDAIGCERGRHRWTRARERRSREGCQRHRGRRRSRGDHRFAEANDPSDRAQRPSWTRRRRSHALRGDAGVNSRARASSVGAAACKPTRRRPRCETDETKPASTRGDSPPRARAALEFGPLRDRRGVRRAVVVDARLTRAGEFTNSRRPNRSRWRYPSRAGQAR